MSRWFEAIEIAHPPSTQTLACGETVRFWIGYPIHARSRLDSVVDSHPITAAALNGSHHPAGSGSGLPGAASRYPAFPFAIATTVSVQGCVCRTFLLLSSRLGAFPRSARRPSGTATRRPSPSLHNYFSGSASGTGGHHQTGNGRWPSVPHHFIVR